MALLDWNGGVTVLDCGGMERLAAQTLNQEEYELYNNPSDQESFPLITNVTTRKLAAITGQCISESCYSTGKFAITSLYIL